jgi:hypothetical protein
MEQLYIEGLEPTPEDRLQHISNKLGETALHVAQATAEYRAWQEQRAAAFLDWMYCVKADGHSLPPSDQ